MKLGSKVVMQINIVNPSLDKIADATELLPMRLTNPTRVSETERPKNEVRNNLMTTENQNSDRNIWSAESTIQLIKESAAALLGLAIVIYTLVLSYNTVILAGNPKITDAKDILMLMLSLAGVVVGYYFGRVPSDARATQAQAQANEAIAQKEQVTAKAQAIADQIDQILTQTVFTTVEARSAITSTMDTSTRSDLRHIRDKLRQVSK